MRSESKWPGLREGSRSLSHISTHLWCLPGVTFQFVVLLLLLLLHKLKLLHTNLFTLFFNPHFLHAFQIPRLKPYILYPSLMSATIVLCFLLIDLQLTNCMFGFQKTLWPLLRYVTPNHNSSFISHPSLAFFSWLPLALLADLPYSAHIDIILLDQKLPLRQ